MSDHGKLAAVVFLASTMGKPLPGISVAELTTQLALHLKDFFTSVKDVHSRLFPGKEMGELQPVMQAYVTTATMHDKWKTFSRDLFPNGFSGTRASDEEACIKKLSFDLGWWLFALARFHEASRASASSFSRRRTRGGPFGSRRKRHATRPCNVHAWGVEGGQKPQRNRSHQYHYFRTAIRKRR
jgi:hypothetical protein